MIGWTLGRYFFIRYVQITLYFLLGIFALALLLDFTENASKLSNLPDYSVWAALALSAMRVPFIMQQMIPFVALFSAMATLISLNRKYELVVARSVGVSAWQFLCLPVSVLSCSVLPRSSFSIHSPLTALPRLMKSRRHGRPAR